MTSFDNALKSDEGNSVYPPDLAKAIFELELGWRSKMFVSIHEIRNLV